MHNMILDLQANILIHLKKQAALKTCVYIIILLFDLHVNIPLADVHWFFFLNYLCDLFILFHWTVWHTTFFVPLFFMHMLNILCYNWFSVNITMLTQKVLQRFHCQFRISAKCSFLNHQL